MDAVISEELKYDKSHLKHLKKHFPWHDAFWGLILPKVVFYLLLLWNMFIAAPVVAMGWCLAQTLWDYKKTKKLEWFALLSLLLIFGRTMAILADRNPNLNLLADAVDNFVYGTVFIGSLFFSRTLIEMAVGDLADGRIPDQIRKTPYYSLTWKILTIVWGGINILTGMVLIYLKRTNPYLENLFDDFSGWPLTILLLLFSIEFPIWYWHKIWHKIESYEAEKNL